MFSPELVKAMAVAAELTGARFSPEAAETMLEILAQYPEPAVLKALQRCPAELKFPLTLSAVLERIDDGHLGPESAWALVAGLTEDDTIVWTEEIAGAFDVVSHMLADRVAARMAFLEAYRAKLADARTDHRPPRWGLSIGQDPARRAGPIARAVELGRLSVEQARRSLPPAEWIPVWGQPALPAGPGVERRAVQDVIADLARRKAHDARTGNDARRPPMERDPQRHALGDLPISEAS